MTLKELRKSIDGVDDRLIPLLCERLALVDKVRALKRETGTAAKDVAREEEILLKVSSLAGEPYADDVATLYRAMFAVTRNREER